MALYPIRLLKDKNRHPFFPFNTLESVLVDGTNKNLADLLDEIYTKDEVNAMFTTELSKFSVYDSVSELPATARDGAVAAIDDNETYIMYMFYDNSWHALTQKGDKGDPGSQGPAGPYFTPSVNAAGDISWTNNGGLTNPETKNIKGPQGLPGADGTDGQDGADGEDGFSPIATVSKSGKVATISITDKNGTTTATVSDGEDGSGGGTWGSITGTLSNQTDLKNALDAKQDTLVSGTNIKTINNTSLLGSGNIEIDASTELIDVTEELEYCYANQDPVYQTMSMVISSQTLINKLNSVKNDIASGNIKNYVLYYDPSKIVTHTFSSEKIYYNISYAFENYFAVLNTTANGSEKIYINCSDTTWYFTYWYQSFLGPEDPNWGSIRGTLSNQTDLQNALDGKQATLVSGTNIKTINNTSLLGSGNITIQGGGSGLETLTSPVDIGTLDDGIYRLPAGSMLQYYYEPWQEYLNILTDSTATDAILGVTNVTENNENIVYIWFLQGGPFGVSEYGPWGDPSFVYFTYNKTLNNLSSNVRFFDFNYIAVTLNDAVPRSDIVDNLTTNASNKPLSAKQGRTLNNNKQDKIDSTHKLSSDLVDDTNNTNKFVTANEKTTWGGKQDALVSGTNIKTINNESLLGSGNISISGGLTELTSPVLLKDLSSGVYRIPANCALLTEDNGYTIKTTTFGGILMISQQTDAASFIYIDDEQTVTPDYDGGVTYSLHAMIGYGYIYDMGPSDDNEYDYSYEEINLYNLYNAVDSSKIKTTTNTTAGNVYDVTYINSMLGNIESLLGGI